MFCDCVDLTWNDPKGKIKNVIRYLFINTNDMVRGTQMQALIPYNRGPPARTEMGLY